MGNKGGKPGASGKPSKLSEKPAKLTDKDIKTLTQQTGLSKEAIEGAFKKFMDGNADGKLDKNEFNKLYPSLRNEPVDNLDEISAFVFRGFDTDNNGYLTFNEFMVAYALTSKGDVSQKLNYAFELYDADNNGYLTANEVKEVVTAMLDLLGADKKGNNPQTLAAECMKELDKSNDGKVTKEEFVNGLLKNYALRSLMNPFG